MKRFIPILILIPSLAFGASATFRWDANTESDLAGYKLLAGDSPGGPYDIAELSHDIPLSSLSDPANPSFDMEIPTDRIYYFVMIAYDNEEPPLPSGYSNEVNSEAFVEPIIIPGPPAAPTGLTGELVLLPDTLLTDITVANGGTYEVVEGGLSEGSLVYGDRDFVFQAIPDAYRSLTYIRTLNDDKASSGDWLSFSLNGPTIVYVAHDDRIAPKPAWLANFVDTGDDLITSDATLSLYSMWFDAGMVVLGGNEGGGYSMYVVVTR